MDKQKMMAAARTAFSGSLNRVEGVEPLEVYVKRFSAKEFRDLMARQEAFEERFDDGYNPERQIATELFDETGRPLFDPENMEDVLFLAELPWAVRQTLALASASANTGDGLKNRPTTGKNSS